MPGPEHLGPLGAHLVGDGFGWCSGRVLFAGGSEVALVDQPRLLEVVRSGDVVSVARVLDAVIPRAFLPAESSQASQGGGNPRFGPIYREPAPAEPAGGDVRSCILVSDRPVLGDALTAELEARSVTCHRVDVAHGFRDAAEAVRAVEQARGPVDAIVVAPAGRSATDSSGETWERVLDEHRGIVEDIHVDATWARAAADAGHPLRLVNLSDAATAGGRSRAQASAQLARAAAGATEGRVTAFAASIEAPEKEAAVPAAALVGHLLAHDDARGLAGAELVVGAGWLGLRSHPRPVGSVVYGGPDVPDWLDATLKEMAGEVR
jgi:hypothetical protein